MPPSITAHLQAAIDAVRGYDGGTPAGTPHPTEDDRPQPLGVAVMTAEGRSFAAGDADVEFPLQSISKALVYAMALDEHGFEAVEATVDHEPSGESYDSISVEDGTGRPDNPMINAGAMTVHALIGGPLADTHAPHRRTRVVTRPLAAVRPQAADDDRARRARPTPLGIHGAAG